LLAKQSALVERQRDYHEAMAGFSRLIAKSNERLPQTAGFNEFQAAAPIGETRHAPIGNYTHDADVAAVSPAQVIAAAQTAQKPKRRFGLFPVVIAVLFGGSLTALFWSMQGSDTTTTASALPVVTPNKAATPPVPAIDPPVQPQAPAAKEVATPAVKEKAQPAKVVEVAKVQQPVGGTYEITQASRVYAAPSELSEQMGDIEPGVRVNVVNAKNGWLEIHSKHGRPPGYIRKESARVLARN
jgi:pyruvate/2-oxoglutarate dehydrogenase complex dihydrolipoamide acyltransferase (E2) component